MKFAVVVFPGSNCDDDMVYVLRDIFGQQVTKVFHKETQLPAHTDCVIVPGGFSYGDYLRSGAIARFSPIMQAIQYHATRGGYVWGICNGFQILTEAGLLEGALLKNTSQKYICKNVFLSPQSSISPLTKSLTKPAYQIPIAHGDGRYYADDNTLKKLEDNAQILFKYCSPTGEIHAQNNPNGSLFNIAGVCSANHRVLGMMPHPERASDDLGENVDGKDLFLSLFNNF